MLVYRLSKAAYIRDLSGTGGLYGSGRWHQKGTRILYTSQTLALAKLEVLANTPLLPRHYALLVLNIPDNIARRVLMAAQLPPNWRHFPAPKALVAFTDDWIAEGRCLVMQVPSVHSPYEVNYLINPLHPEASRLEVVEVLPHDFDERLKNRP